jgi:hypothetical protein
MILAVLRRSAKYLSSREAAAYSDEVRSHPRSMRGVVNSASLGRCCFQRFQSRAVTKLRCGEIGLSGSSTSAAASALSSRVKGTLIVRFPSRPRGEARMFHINSRAERGTLYKNHSAMTRGSLKPLTRRADRSRPPRPNNSLQLRQRTLEMRRLNGLQSADIRSGSGAVPREGANRRPEPFGKPLSPRILLQGTVR